MNTTEFDIFYISYDEPNCEEHWADLFNKAPWAKRVHGVKGFDSAHKACAEQSETDYFITVDGDNIVDLSFFQESVDPKPNSVYSWKAKNHVNGLAYGNGGLKLWPKDLVLNMRTHENADNEKSEIDFCWDIDYVQMNNMYSTTYINGSPYQAFRAGFREGVKMSLDQGEKVPIENFQSRIHRKNYERMLVWCNVGRDVENGTWAMYGTRLGCYMTNLTDWDMKLVRDYEWFPEYWRSQGIAHMSHVTLDDNIDDLGRTLKEKLGMEMCDLDADASAFFKKVYVNPPRVGITVRETEVSW